MIASYKGGILSQHEFLQEDPRIDLPPLGSMGSMSHLCDGVIRCIAPNASFMTLDGTNTYVIYGGNNSCYIIDPGPVDETHLLAVREVVNSQKFTPLAILLTHGHADHASAAQAFASEFEVPIYENVASVTARSSLPLFDGMHLDLDGDVIRVIFTPGHSADHVCFMLSSGNVLTGDHVLGRGTSLIVDPDGRLDEYIKSLVLLQGLNTKSLLPGHGPELSAERAPEVISYYLGHRFARMEHIISLLTTATLDVGQITAEVYGSTLDSKLTSVATRQTLATIHSLIQYGFLEANNTHSYAATGKSKDLLRECLLA